MAACPLGVFLVLWQQLLRFYEILFGSSARI